MLLIPVFILSMTLFIGSNGHPCCCCCPAPSPGNGNSSGPSVPDGIPIVSGTAATLTYFTDTTTQCYGTDIPDGPGLAINPLLLGFTAEQWTNSYSSAPASSIPWCGLKLSVTVGDQTFTGTVIDTCDPVGNPFPDPTTGELIGGKCDYTDVIDLYGDTGLAFLNAVAGDDFYQGALTWEIVG